MRRHQSNKAGAADLVLEESSEEQDRFATTSRKILSKLVEINTSKLVVITGDAGHGKTSMCFDLLENLGVPAAESIRVMKSLKSRGESVFVETESGSQLQTETGRALRVVMDLSYVTYDKAGEILEELWLADDDGVSIVCANEGHLRAAIGKISNTESDDPWSTVLYLLENGDLSGRICDENETVFVVNLNYQSVVQKVEAGDGFVNWVLKSWLEDPQEWQECESCEAKNICPVWESRKQLTEVDYGSGRRRAVGEIFRVAEQAGIVITFRQALMHLAYALSGGLDCEDVERKWAESPVDHSWQYRHLYHQAIFGEELDARERFKIPAMAVFQLVDPGYVSIRAVDDDIDLLDGQPLRPPDPMTLTQSVRTAPEEREYAESVRRIFTFLRRVAFFDAHQNMDSTPDRLRLGLDYGNEFQRLLDGENINEGVRNKLIGGLEALQGIQSPEMAHRLRVLDPAFHSQHMRISAAVVARQLSPSSLQLQVQPDSWSIEAGAWMLSDSVEWSARRLELVLTVPRGDPISIPLGIIEYELLCRWSAGLSSRSQNEEVVRKFLLRLGQISNEGMTSQEEDLEEIPVIVDGNILTLSFAENKLRSWVG